MVAEFLKQFVQEKGQKEQYSFIWIAPRHLHLQSKEKLEAYYEETRALRCSLFETLMISESTIMRFCFLTGKV